MGNRVHKGTEAGSGMSVGGILRRESSHGDVCALAEDCVLHTALGAGSVPTDRTETADTG